MRVFTYVPDIANSADIIDFIDKQLPETAFDVEHAADRGDLSVLLKTQDYDAVVVMADEPGVYTLLDDLMRRDLKGPVVCLYQNEKPTTLFNMYSRGVLVALPYRADMPAGTLSAAVKNAQRGFLGQSLVKDYGPLKIDFSKHMVTVNDIPVHFPKTELTILELLLSNPNRVKTKAQIMDSVYSVDTDVQEKIVDVFICKLRDKLDAAQSGLGGIIQTVWGRGYMFVPATELSNPYAKQFGDLQFDFMEQRVTIKGEPVDLTITEFMVLKTFAAKYPDPVSRAELVEQAGRFGREATEDTVERALYAIGRKLEAFGPEYKRLILPANGSGYLMNLSGIDEKAAKRIEQEIETLGPIKINRTLGIATFKNKPLDLGGRELDVLEAIVDTYPRTVTAAELAIVVYGGGGQVAALNAQLYGLRAKLREANDGVDPIVVKRGMGMRLELPVDKSLKKLEELRDVRTVGPWTIDKSRREIAYRDTVLSLNRQQLLLLEAMLDAYPKSLSRADVIRAVYDATDHADDKPVNSLFSQLKGVLTAQLGTYDGGIRKIDDAQFRIDLDINDMTPEHLEACEVTEIGAWAVNRTAHMVLFDGDPIAVTDTELSLMGHLTSAFPNMIATATLATDLFDGDQTRMNACMTNFRRKLREGHMITELPFVNKRGMGYVINADHRELAADKIEAFERVQFGPVEVNYSLGQLVVAGNTIEANPAELFALTQISRADMPLSAAAIAKLSQQTENPYTESTIRGAVINLKRKIGLEGVRDFIESRGGNYFLNAHRDTIVANSKITTVGDLRLNDTLEELTFMGKTIPLTPSEYALVKTMAANPRIPLTPEDLGKLSTDDGQKFSDATFNHAKNNLTRKLVDAGVPEHIAEIIRNKIRVGYYLACMEDQLDRSRLNGKRDTRVDGDDIIEAGALKINPITDTVTFHDEPLDKIQGKVVDLLALLVRRHGSVLLRTDIATHFFGDDCAENMAKTMPAISSLRHMLNRSVEGLGDSLIHDVGDVGYTLTLEPSDFRKAISAAGLAGSVPVPAAVIGTQAPKAPVFKAAVRPVAQPPAPQKPGKQKVSRKIRRAR